MAVLTGVYVIFGGYMATAINDFIQGIIMIVGIVTVIAAVLKGQGGFLAALDSLAKVSDPAVSDTPGVFASFFGPDPVGLLGVVLLNVQNSYNFIESVVYGITGGLGFLLAMVLFSGVRRRVDEAEPPKAFKGMPITLISAALVSLSFMCFAGVADNLFGVL